MSTDNRLPSKRKTQAPLKNDLEGTPADDILVHSMSSGSESLDTESTVLQDIKDLDFDDFISNPNILESWYLRDKEVKFFIGNEVDNQKTDLENESEYFDEALKWIKEEIEHGVIIA